MILNFVDHLKTYMCTVSRVYSAGVTLLLIKTNAESSGECFQVQYFRHIYFGVIDRNVEMLFLVKNYVYNAFSSFEVLRSQQNKKCSKSIFNGHHSFDSLQSI